MSGYIYVIRKAADELKNVHIYKVGKTTNDNPYQYLKSRYDKGFKIYNLLYVNYVNECEKELLRELNNNSLFKLVEGREMFELLNDATIYDIINILLKIVNDHTKNKICYDSKKEIDVFLAEKLHSSPKNIQDVIKKVIGKYYDLIPKYNIKFKWKHFASHDEFKDIELDQEVVYAIIYDMVDKKIIPITCHCCRDTDHINSLSLKEKYKKKLEINKRFTESNVIELFEKEKNLFIYPNGFLLEERKNIPNYYMINTSHVFKIANFIIKKTPCVGTTVESFIYNSYVIKHIIKNFMKKYDLWDPGDHCVSNGEVILACYILGVNINCSYYGPSVSINIMVDTIHPLYENDINL